MKKMFSILLASVMMITGSSVYAENASGNVERTVKFYSVNNPSRILCDGENGDLSVKHIQGEAKPQYLIMSDKQIEADHLAARFLVNDKETASPENGLAFIQGRLYGDSIIVLNTGNAEKTIRLKSSGDQSYNPVLFSFRLIDPDPNGDFLIESWSMGNQTGEWIKLQNGIPVTAHTSLDRALKSEAEVFNLDIQNEDLPTTRADIYGYDTTIDVTADYGIVIISGASGKKVQITNATGQAVSNAIINSDYETIAVPSGIALVAVDGKPAVKVIVK